MKDLILKTHKIINDSLRYVSVSFGERAYIPAFPDSTLKDKMGDCKDFSTLMIARLRAHGLDAFPALMSGRYKHDLFPGPPSFDAVDHMIVHVPSLGLWIDPTGPVTPPGVLPYHLSGANALVLYPDSIVMRELPRNTDGAYSGTSRYVCREQGEDLDCERDAVLSHLESWQWRSYLRDFPPQRWSEILNPPDWSAATRITEVSTRVMNMDSDKDNLQIVRTFIGRKAIAKVSGKTVTRFPETPYLRLFHIADPGDKTQPLVLENPVREAVEVTLVTSKPFRWPAFVGLNYNGIVFKMTPLRRDGVRMDIALPAGEIKTPERDSLQAALCRYKDFFSALLAE